MNNQDTLWISLINGVGIVSLQKIIDISDKERIEKLTNNDIIDLFKLAHVQNKRIKIPTKEDINSALTTANKVIEDSKENNIEIIGHDDNSFPSNLKVINSSPRILFVKGDVSNLKRRSVAVVGTRSPTTEGIRLGRRITEILCDNQYAIVSGLAVGCDTIAHEEALKKGARTIAVSPGGLHSTFPSTNEKLAKDIIESNGTIISEIPYGDNPNKNTFIQRDRIISGLSQAVVVIQSGLSGGTMHTANFAIEQGKLLAAILPANSENFEGNYNLVANGAIALNDKDSVNGFLKVLDDSNGRSNAKDQQLNLF